MARMIRPISMGPRFIGSSGAWVATSMLRAPRPSEAPPNRGPASAVAVADLRGAGGGGLQVGEDRPQLALERRALAAQPPGRAEQPVAEHPQDDDGQDGDGDPQDQ